MPWAVTTRTSARPMAWPDRCARSRSGCDTRSRHPQRRMKRRDSIAASAALLAAGCVPGPVPLPEEAPELALPPMPANGARLVDEIERLAFEFFRDTPNPRNGLAPDRWPTPAFCSIAAVGFALSAWIVGAERRWIPREEARSRVITTLAFLHEAPQGPQRSGTIGHKG